ncbi:hypothetical protein NDA13_003461 [Ustilago tritici]|nr:hypothetical protein NDA13_003461 [Ustilago tritici]
MTPSYGSAGIPMDLSGSEQYNDSTHSRGLPPILDLMDPTNSPNDIASTSGTSIAGAGDGDIFTTPSPLQTQLSFSTAGGSDVFDSSSSPSSAQLSPGTKHKQGAVDPKCDSLAEAFYCSSINSLQIHLQLEQEHTRCERTLEAECTKHKEMHMQYKREEKERNKRICAHDHDMVMEIMHLLASQASGKQDHTH